MLYLIKLNIILAILCLLFQVLMHRDTFFGIRRAMLLGIYAVALLLPLCDVQSLLSGRAVAEGMAADYATYVLPTLEVTADRFATMGFSASQSGAGSFSWTSFVVIAWLLILALPALWFLGKMLWQIGYIIYLRYTCARTTVLGREVSVYPKSCSPFSFGRWIFLSQESMNDETKLREVMTHELTHVRQLHTFDIVLAELFCIGFWWNPATWVMRREVRLNLEFIADAAVVGRDVDRRTYQYHLLGFASQMNVATLTNNFNVLPLKRRIVMMNAKRTRHTGMLKYILFVPVAAAIVLLCNIDAMARTIAAHVQDPLETAAVLPQTQQQPEAAVAETTAVAEPQAVAEQAETPVAATPEAVPDKKPTSVEETLSIVELKDGKEPLFVVNGSVKTLEEVRNTVVKDSILSLTVLKDESATSKWGSRGANGVVMITTRDAYTGEILEHPDELAEYPGGDAALFRHLASNCKYPDVARKWGVQGKVYVQFVVETDGTMTDIHVVTIAPNQGQTKSEVGVMAKRSDMTEDEQAAAQGHNDGLQALKDEALRVVSSLPEKWKPALKDGVRVRCRFTIPVSFRLR